LLRISIKMCNTEMGFLSIGTSLCHVVILCLNERTYHQTFLAFDWAVILVFSQLLFVRHWPPIKCKGMRSLHFRPKSPYMSEKVRDRDHGYYGSFLYPIDPCHIQWLWVTWGAQCMWWISSHARTVWHQLSFKFGMLTSVGRCGFWWAQPCYPSQWSRTLVLPNFMGLLHMPIPFAIEWSELEY